MVTNLILFFDVENCGDLLFVNTHQDQDSSCSYLDNMTISLSL